ncbi:mitochondrial ATPase expression-domain-containing protein [Aspergillus spinulosporus]
MRLVLQSRSFNSLSSAGSLSRHGIQKLPLGAASTQFARLFTTRGSLAAWNPNTKTAPRSKASKPNSDSTSEPSNSESAAPGAATNWNKSKFKASKRQSASVGEHTNEPSREIVSAPRNEMTSEPARDIMTDTASGNAGDQEAAVFDARFSDLDTFRGRKPRDADTVRKEFYAILETAQPDQVMAALLNYDCEELVATMPQSSFIEALHLLSPAHFVEPFKEIYRPLHPYTVQIKRFKAQHTLFDDFVRNLSAIVRIRRSGGQALGLAEYSHLLDCARSLGDALMADHIWNSMRMDNIAPNLECYNHYMEAKVWNSAYTGKEKYRLRITPFAYRRRKFGDLGWEGYGTAGRSVRTEVQEIFDEMTASGIEGDEASIVNLFMAAARVGDNETMECILQTIWNIDVDALRKGQHVEVAEYDRSSPYYPSARLLRAVAHSFSAANDIESAVRIIELVSRSYDVEVPESIWAELFEWAFVLSRRKYGPDAERKSKGLINTSLLENLFETMTKEPYNIEPSAEMHSKLAKTAWVFHRLNDFLYHMRAAYNVLDETRRKRIAAREIVESYLRCPRSADGEMNPQILWSRGFADAVHTYEVLRLLVMQQTRIIERLANLLIHRGDWLGRSFDVWERQFLPQLMEEWRDFIPARVRYATSTGIVQFHGVSYYGSARYSTHARIPVRRPSFNDRFRLVISHQEYDDDFIWTTYKQDMSPGDLHNPLLRRLFEPTIFDYDSHNLDDEVQDQVSELQLPADAEVYGHFSTKSAEASRPRFWVEEAYESAQLKRSALMKAFGSLSGLDDEDQYAVIPNA